MVHEEIVYQGESRMRDVQTGPDGPYTWRWKDRGGSCGWSAWSDGGLP